MTTAVVDSLRAAGIKRAAADESMARYTSWRIGGPADYLCVVEDEGQLLGAVRAAQNHGLHWLVLGGGNNILVSDAGISGLVILNRLKGLVIDDVAGMASLQCGAGAFFARAAQYSATRGYTGMEWGIAIPGTVGGGVVNNAGAHSSDVSRSLLAATVIDDVGNRRELSPTDLSYHYRHSLLKSGHTSHSHLVVTDCRFRLAPSTAREALDRVDELRRHRLRTQPVKEASAGSTFKNPPGDHAGALIDRAGLKGHRIGGAQIAPLHANFILNAGGATANDVAALIRLAQVTVQQQFGILLQPEVQFVGRWPDAILQPILEGAA